MIENERHERRPLWVSLVLRERMKRPAAKTMIGVFGLLFGLAVLTAAVESESSSVLGTLALPIGLAGAGLSAAGAIWSWLALRWVDRNGTWPTLSNVRGT